MYRTILVPIGGCEHARQAGAIMLGRRGLSGLKGLAVGSVSHKMMHLAPCTVATVHSGP